MDWIFQWKWEAMNKSKKWLPLFFHCSVYTIGFIPAFWLYKINFWWLALIFLSHIVFDRRAFEIWLLEKFKGVKKEEIPESLWQILLIGIDQTLHIAVLVGIVIFS